MTLTPEAAAILQRAVAFIDERTLQLYFWADGGNPVAVGTGTLVRFGHALTIVTAAHVLDWHRGGEGRLAVGRVGRSIEVVGCEAAQLRDRGQADLAVLRLDPESANLLVEWTFVDGIAAFRGPVATGHFCAILGYPVAMTQRDTALLKIEADPHVVVASVLPSRAEPLADFDSSIHFLLGHAELVDVNGKQVSAPDLRGISGCAVWSLFVPPHRDETWSEGVIGLAGVETSTYQDDALVRVTHWEEVVRLALTHWPDLKPVFLKFVLGRPRR